MKKRLNEQGPQLFKNHKTIFSMVDEPPSWSDADDSLESMSDPDEEDDMPGDKDSLSRSGVGDGDVDWTWTREEEEEEDFDDFFDAGEGAVVGDRSSRAAQESSQSGGGTEDDPVGPTTPSATAAPTQSRTKRKPSSGFNARPHIGLGRPRRGRRRTMGRPNTDTRNAARACTTCIPPATADNC